MKNTWNLAAVAAVLVFAMFTAITCTPFHLLFPQPAENPPITADHTKEVGHGSTVFSLYVTDKDGIVTEYIIHTTRRTVGAAIRELNLAVYEDLPHLGNHPVYFDGIVTDLAKERTYFGFYVNLKSIAASPDELLILTDTIYELRVEVIQ